MDNSEEIHTFDIKWKPYLPDQDLSRDKINIFSIKSSAHFKDIKRNYADYLSERELGKVSRLFNRKERDRYIVSKYYLNTLLSEVLRSYNLEPSALRKRAVLNKVKFSISHTEDQILIALGSSGVGIDLEFINHSFDFESISSHSFSPAELIYMNGHRDKVLRFYEIWTRKEALLKASGQRIIENMNRICSLPGTVTMPEGTYALQSFKISRNYMASLAFTPSEAPVFWKIS
ncbi:4'-phosphopantetheinyl transferase superfamily protein [Pedobacter sp. SYP-B3415]|uniref:4'-phosphopantetheinyl transferase family protein n=1 Tax=Pedobacter sp. SYP-B3415 TaxID=2496641 RepID=UPI00101D295B|nr:4'-phosphopantetheinyl transferase superfamily protein [Pedobacter sp. SYP-B3415]